MTVTTVRVTGHGADTTPVEANFTQQTNAGKFLGPFAGTAHQIRHRADTEGGNSGGPIERVSDTGSDTAIAIGIHTNAGCDVGDNTGNSGTAFTNPDLWQAIKDFKG
jgi:V8-like Glu-specific endopeptidase